MMELGSAGGEPSACDGNASVLMGTPPASQPQILPQPIELIVSGPPGSPSPRRNKRRLLRLEKEYQGVTALDILWRRVEAISG